MSASCGVSARSRIPLTAGIDILYFLSIYFLLLTS
ncbi:hypothetical protein NT04LS_3274, partial [Listeria seeligeri FSL S4-171]